MEMQFELFSYGAFAQQGSTVLGAAFESSIAEKASRISKLGGRGWRIALRMD